MPITPEIERYLKEQLDSVAVEREKLGDTRAALEKQFEILTAKEAGLRILLAEGAERFTHSPKPEQPGVKEPYKGMTIRKALHYIARTQGPRLRVPAVVDELVRVGMYPTREKARNSVYPEFRRIENLGEFKKVEPGVYEQVADPYAQKNGHVHSDLHPEQLAGLDLA